MANFAGVNWNANIGGIQSLSPFASPFMCNAQGMFAGCTNLTQAPLGVCTPCVMPSLPPCPSPFDIPSCGSSLPSFEQLFCNLREQCTTNCLPNQNVCNLGCSTNYQPLPGLPCLPSPINIGPEPCMPFNLPQYTQQPQVCLPRPINIGPEPSLPFNLPQYNTPPQVCLPKPVDIGPEPCMPFNLPQYCQRPQVCLPKPPCIGPEPIFPGSLPFFCLPPQHCPTPAPSPRPCPTTLGNCQYPAFGCYPMVPVCGLPQCCYPATPYAA